MNLTNRQIEIIDVAGKLLNNGGVSQLTTKNLAKKMHFSEPALYRHFKNKEEIIIGMLKYLGSNMDIRLTESCKKVKSPISKIENLFKKQFIFFEENKHLLVAVFSNGIWENNHRIQSAIQGVMAIKKKHLTAVFSEGIAEKEFTDKIGLDSLTHIAMGAFRLHLLKWKMNNYSYSLSLTGEKLIQDILILIKNNEK